MTKALYTTGEVARLIGKHIETVRRWAECGDIEATVMCGRYYIPAREVERLVGHSLKDPASNDRE